MLTHHLFTKIKLILLYYIFSVLTLKYMRKLINRTLEAYHNPISDTLLVNQTRAAEKHRRSIAKAITYRLLSIVADSIAAYFFTHNILLTTGIVLFVNGYSLFVYYFHERIWAYIHWGHDKKF